MGERFLAGGRFRVDEQLATSEQFLVDGRF